MTSTLEWSNIRTDTIRRFRDEIPHAQTEAEIVEVFEQMPGVVLRAIDEVAESVAQGKARSGWAVLRSRVHGSLEPQREVSVEGNDRELAVQRAEAWLRSAGQHFDRESELEAELFEDQGMLRRWAGDEVLRERMVALYRQLRPGGEELEDDALRRHRERSATRGKVDEVLAARAALGFQGFVTPGVEDEPF